MEKQRLISALKYLYSEEINEEIKEILNPISIHDLTSFTDLELLKIFEKAADKKFTGRLLAPANLEEKKFKISSVVLQAETYFVIKGTKIYTKGDSLDNVEFCFDVEHIIELYTSKQTQTILDVFSFVK